MLHPDPICFSGATFDRAAHLRREAAALRTRAEARALRIKADGTVCAHDSALTWEAVPTTGEAVFLGLVEGAPRFAVPVAGEKEEGDGFAPLRALAPCLSVDEACLAGTAKAILGWHQTHGFCARCGAPSRVGDGGWRRDCPSCGAQHFPRTDPVVIMAVTDGTRLALGGQAEWEGGRVSVIAGFVEPGETIEEAVARETQEEMGLTVREVRYHSSQPWPFPSSIMIGCLARVDPAEITRNDEELSVAFWLTRTEVVDLMAGRLPGRSCPPPFAIANRLIRAWLDETA